MSKIVYRGKKNGSTPPEEQELNENVEEQAITEDVTEDNVTNTLSLIHI